MEQNFDIGFFIDDIVDDPVFGDIDTETRAELRADLLQRLETRIKAAMLMALPEEVRPEFERVVDAGNDAAIQQFFQQHIKNLPQLIADEMLVFRSLFIIDKKSD